MTDVLAVIGGLTIGTLAFRTARWFWKSRNWKPTPWGWPVYREPSK